MTIALVVDAPDAVGGEPDGHCEPTSAAVVVGGICFTFKPFFLSSGGGMIRVGGGEGGGLRSRAL